MIIQANNSAIHIIGRSYVSPKGICFAFSGTEIALNIISTTLSVALFDEIGNNCFSLWINNQNTGLIIKTHQGQHEYQIPISPDIEQNIRLVKRTEARCGEVEIIHFSASSNAQLLPVVQKSRTMLFLGDSITCGYGIEAADQFCSFVNEEEDVLQSYAGLTAQALDAQAHYICYSGKGIYRNWGDPIPFQNTMIEIVNTVTPQNTEIVYDWNSYAPNCVVIGLGSNDFGNTLPIDVEVFIATYCKFVLDVKQKLNNSPTIFCLASPLLPNIANKTLRTAIEQVQQQSSNIHYIAQTRQVLQTGYGADWHPSRKQAQINAQETITAIKSIMQWN